MKLVICNKPTKTLTRGEIYRVEKVLKDVRIVWDTSHIIYRDLYLIMNNYGRYVRVSPQRFKDFKT